MNKIPEKIEGGRLLVRSSIDISQAVCVMFIFVVRAYDRMELARRLENREIFEFLIRNIIQRERLASAVR